MNYVFVVRYGGIEKRLNDKPYWVERWPIGEPMDPDATYFAD